MAGPGGMGALGALLGGAGGGGGGMAAASQPGAGGQVPGADAAGGAGIPPSGLGADAQLQQMQQGMQAIRQLGEQTKLLAQQFPETASTMQEIQQLLKQAVIEMAPMAPMQTGSGMAVPGGGMGGGVRPEPRAGGPPA